MNGVEGQSFDGCWGIAFSPDSRRVAHVANRGRNWLVVVDGARGKEYDEIGKHIASGDSKKAARAAEELQNHIRNSGIGTENPDISHYASELKDLRGSSSWGKERSRERIKNMRAKYGKNESLIPEVFKTLDMLSEAHSGDAEALVDIFDEYGLDNRLAQAMARKIVSDGKHKELSVGDIEAVLKKQVHDPKKLKRIAQAAYDAL